MVNKYCVLGFDHPKAKTVLLPVVEADFKLPTEDADDARALFVDQVPAPPLGVVSLLLW